MTPIEYVQLKAFARQDGALLALLWVATFLLYIIGVSNQLLGLAAFFLMCYTPFFVGERLGNHYAIELHILMDGDISLHEAHEKASEVEDLLREHYGEETHVAVHVEPK